MSVCPLCLVKPAFPFLRLRDLFAFPLTVPPYDSDYLIRNSCIRQVFKLDPGSVADLLLHLRGQESGMKSTRSPFNYEGDRRDADGGRIWAMMEVMDDIADIGAKSGSILCLVQESGFLVHQ